MRNVLKCKNCGHEQEMTEGSSVFCESCGVELFDDESAKSPSLVKGAVDKMTAMVGLERIESFSFSNLFSEIFKRHGGDAMEKYWAEGTIGSIPSISKVNVSWPQPWFFCRMFLLILVACTAFALGSMHFGNAKFLPGLIVLGCVAIPLSLTVFFFEVNVRRNVSLYLVLKLFLLGGAVSMLITLPGFETTGKLGLNNSMGPSVAGIVEEIAKLATVVLFVRSLRYPYILNGLLFGAAVGAGFAAFESAGYVFEALLQTQSGGQMLFVLFLRAVFSIVSGHILWTGMSAAALWKVKGNRKFQFSMLLDWRFLVIFFIAMGSHMVWNWNINFSLLTGFDKFILLGIVDWIVIFSLIQSGLNQIRREKSRYAQQPEQEPVLGGVLQEQVIYVQQVVGQSLPERSHGYDHLNIKESAKEAMDKEVSRQKPSFTGRPWQKYYGRDDEK